jgi:glycosyltransferase involved in cell wall biosynthesis
MLISLIVPCYNEEQSLPILKKAIDAVTIERSEFEYELIFIDDGSKDGTLSLLEKFAKEDPSCHYISFSRNFGKEAAMYAGLCEAKGMWVGILDADLQDPPSLLPQMFDLLSDEDCDMVATRRVSRIGEPKIRSFFARRFYSLINHLSDVDIVDGARDFRLLKREVVDSILLVSERQRFSKGIFSWVGFHTKWIEFENIERSAGETKWSFWKLFRYAIDGIVSFSTIPLRLATYTGFLVSAAAFVYMLYYVIRTIIAGFIGTPAPGYPSLLSIVLFLGGVTLLALGILGEYMARTYMEVKQRPIYLVRRKK